MNTEIFRELSKPVFLIVLFSILLPEFISGQQTHSTPSDTIPSWKWFQLKDRPSIQRNWSFYWGYNRSKYLKSTIHFSGPNYDFSLFDVEATDRPSPFSFDQYFNPVKASIPQYNYRLGYRFDQGLGISFGVDHMKYVVQQDQKVVISGVISEGISPKYAGAYLNDTITILSDFLKYEHSDGLNLVTLDFEFLSPIVESPHSKFKFDINLGLGGIWVVTKTKIDILGEGIDNDFHVAGFALSGKVGPRFEFWNRLFILSEFKTGYMAVSDVLIENAAPKKANQTIIFFEYYVVAGAMFRLGRKKD